MLRSRPITIALYLVPIALPIIVYGLILSTAVNVPFWDEWEWADLIYKFHRGTLTFTDLWTQHNEHRLLFPQLILLALDRFGGWSPIREQFVSLFFQICTQIGLIVMIRRTLRGIAAAIVCCLSSIFLYGFWQAENFTWGFQMAWFMCNAAAVGVAAFLTRPKRGVIDIVASVAIAVIASYSSSQGLLVWLVGLIAIGVAPRDARRLGSIWCALAAIVYVIYEHGLGKSSVGHFDVLARPFSALHYVFIYLGSPLGRASGGVLSTLMGLILTIVTIAAVAGDLSADHRLRHLRKRGPWYALSAYAFACAVATAAGRAGLGLDQAMSSRYTSISDLAWIAAIVIGASFIGQEQRLARVAWRTGVPAIGGLVIALMVVQSDVEGWREWSSTEAGWAGARKELQANDPAALGKLYPSDARIENLLDELRDVHDGPFRNG